MVILSRIPHFQTQPQNRIQLVKYLPSHYIPILNHYIPIIFGWIPRCVKKECLDLDLATLDSSHLVPVICPDIGEPVSLSLSNHFLLLAPIYCSAISQKLKGIKKQNQNPAPQSFRT